MSSAVAGLDLKISASSGASIMMVRPWVSCSIVALYSGMSVCPGCVFDSDTGGEATAVDSYSSLALFSLSLFAALPVSSSEIGELCNGAVALVDVAVSISRSVCLVRW